VSNTLNDALDASEVCKVEITLEQEGPASVTTLAAVQLAMSCPNGTHVALRINEVVVVRQLPSLESHNDGYYSANDGNWIDMFEDRHLSMMQWRPG
jgi:hypothetical protein